MAIPSTGALLINPRRKRRKVNTKTKATRKRNTSTASRRSMAAKKAAATRRRNASRRSMAAKKAAATRRRNARKLVTRRANTRKGMVRKTARRAYMKRRNPARRKYTIARRRMNRRKNPAFIVKPVQNIVKKIPVIGGFLSNIVGFATPAALGAVSVYPSMMILDRLGGFLPARVQGMAYSISGAVMGAVFTSKMGKKYLGAEMAQQLAVAAASAGGAIDFYRWYTGAEGGIETGDGMAYMVQPYSGAHMGGSHMGALEVMAGAGHHDQSMAADYAEACMGDAYYSGADFSQDEAAALMAGPRAWRARFRRPPRRVVRRFGRRGPVSPLANKHGHRWGWLIRCVGFSAAQQIAALPPAQRQQVIAQLRQQAVDSIPALIAASASGAEGPVSASEAEEMGALITMAGAY
jgi:hypothetical protein